MYHLIYLQIFPIILGTKTVTVGDDSTGGKKYYLVSCGGPCSSITITLQPTSGDPELYAKVGSRPTVSSHTCSDCDCQSQ